MNPRAFGRTITVAVVGCILAFTLITAAIPRAMAAQPPEKSTWPADATRIRLEGYLKAIGPGKWLVGEWTILIDDQTGFVEKRGRVEVGAWVVVWGIRSETGSIYGELIEVDRPAGRTGPILQFSGILTKQSGQWWIISGTLGDMLVEVTEITQISGAPERGWLVWVVAENRETMLRAIAIEAIADSPESVPVEFEGDLEAFGPDGWQVAGQPFTLDEKAVIIGQPAIGRSTEVLATQHSSGALVAHFVYIADASAGAAASSALATVTDGGTLDLPGLVAHASAVTTGHWDTPTPVASGLTEAAQPVLAYAIDGTAHALWESNGGIFYASRSPGQSWSQAQRIASGIQPTLALDSRGQLHALFANQFLGNYEIYHVSYEIGKWTLPKNIAHTSGVSLKPALAAGPMGELRATWMDNSPAYSAIYAATWSGAFWTNAPVPNARGESPAIAIAQNGTIFLTWQDRVPSADNPTGVFDIFLSEQQGDSWALPINISDRERVDATEVSITTTADGLAHLVWIEGSRTVCYDFGRGLYWPESQIIVQAAQLARKPRIAAKGDLLHVVWDEGEALRAISVPKAPSTWPRPDVMPAYSGTLKDVGLAVEQTGGVTLIWVQTSQPNGVSIYESHYEGQPRHSIWLPIMLTN